MAKPDDPIPFQVAADFAERCAATRRRMEAGEHMTYQDLSALLGLPCEFVIAAVEIGAAIKSGQPVLIDPRKPRLDG